MNRAIAAVSYVAGDSVSLAVALQTIEEKFGKQVWATSKEEMYSPSVLKNLLGTSCDMVVLQNSGLSVAVQGEDFADDGMMLVGCMPTEKGFLKALADKILKGATSKGRNLQPGEGAYELQTALQVLENPPEGNNPHVYEVTIEQAAALKAAMTMINEIMAQSLMGE